MDDKAAVLEFKKAIMGKVAVMKDSGLELAVGGPGMTVKVTFSKGVVETKASMFGKMMLGTVDSVLEVTEGFEKI